MFSRLSLLGVLLLLILAIPQIALADFIDFTTDSPDAKPNGWQSVQSTNVTFFDTIGAGLQVADWVHQSIGNGLAILGDDASELRMVFSGATTDLTLAFGNDDPGWANVGDFATLRLFLANGLVGTVNVGVNANDVMDQIISTVGSGWVFDEAYFKYNTNQESAEIVDNIEFNAAGVPEPGSMLMLATGLLGLSGAIRRMKN